MSYLPPTRDLRVRFDTAQALRFLGEQGEESTVASPDDLRKRVAELEDGYRSYLGVADRLADGPSIRIIEAALGDKQRQAQALAGLEELSADDPAHGGRYFLSSFYWPDAVDPSYPYGEGVALQIRSPSAI